VLHRTTANYSKNLQIYVVPDRTNFELFNLNFDQETHHVGKLSGII
jgi:hypothetical protein